MNNINLYLKLHSTYEMKNENSIHIESLLNLFKEQLLNNNIIISFNKKPNYMTESNMCISFEFNFQAEEHITIEYLKSFIKTIYTDSFECFVFHKEKHELFIHNDLIANFKDNKIQGCLKSISELDSKIKTIEFNGSMPLAFNDDIELYLKFLDENNNVVEYENEWVNTIKEEYKKHFDANSVDSITLGLIIKLLIGDSPTKELYDSINTVLFINTEYMDEFDCSEKNKVFENSKLSLD